MPESSLILTAYNRAAQLERTLKSIYAQSFKDFETIIIEDGDDGGETRKLCERFGCIYLQRKNRPDQPFANPAPLINAGIRKAQGEVLILQNAECRHVSPGAIEALTKRHRENKRLAVFASVIIDDANSEAQYWGSHINHAVSPYFFCGSLRREWVECLRGFDEDFKYWGAEDDDFAWRLQALGIAFEFPADIIVEHQWHPVSKGYRKEENIALFEKHIRPLREGRESPVRNLGRDWGVLDA